MEMYGKGYPEGIREDSVHCRQLRVLNKQQKYNRNMKLQKQANTYPEGIIVKPVVGTALLQLLKFWRKILGNKVARQNMEFPVNLEFQINNDFKNYSCSIW